MSERLAAKCSISRGGSVNANEREESAAAVVTLLPAGGLKKCLFRRTAKSPGLFPRPFPVIQDCGKDMEPSADRKGGIYNSPHIHLIQIRYSYLLHRHHHPLPARRFNAAFHCVSLLNLGGRTHSAAAVYITATPVKNTPPSRGSTVAAVQLKNMAKNKAKYRNLRATAGSQGLFMLSMNQQIILILYILLLR